MIYGSIIFSGKEQDLTNVQKYIEMDDALHASALFEGPVPYDLYEGAIKYGISLHGDEWIDIIALQEQLQHVKADVEIVLAVTDGYGFVDVITTNGDDDIECFENDDVEAMSVISEQYGFNMIVDEAPVEEEDDEIIDDESYDGEWEE